MYAGVLVQVMATLGDLVRLLSQLGTLLKGSGGPAQHRAWARVSAASMDGPGHTSHLEEVLTQVCAVHGCLLPSP